MTMDGQVHQDPAQSPAGNGGSQAKAATSPQTGSAENGVAFVALSTESPHAARGDVRLADLCRILRRAGHPSRVFQVYITPADDEENARRVQMLVDRLIRERCKWVVFNELWTPAIGRQLRNAGIGIIETRSHTYPEAIFSEDADLLANVRDTATGQPINEYINLVEVVGPTKVTPITAIDLRVQQSCGYKRTLHDNPFYQDVLDTPEVAAHRGCGHCVSALPRSNGSAEDIAGWVIDRIRMDRKTFPSVESFWMPFAETFYDSLAIAFRSNKGDPAWQGITLTMQCRPDVIAHRAADIETLAADAAECGTTIRIGVVGFENFSPPEILVLNRGASPDDLDSAAVILNRWASQPPTGLVVRGFTPSFILFTPWTRIDDLNTNLRHITQHGLWAANIERLRIGPGTPAFAKAMHDGLISDEPVQTAAHPNGYTAERRIRFADPNVAAVSAGFERLRPLAYSEQPELLTALIEAVLASPNPAAIDWDGVANAWQDVGAAARGN